MSVQTLAAWLRCPNCFNDLEVVTDASAGRAVAASAAAVLGCARGHRFDVNRRGYVTLLPSRSRVVGDSRAMLDARAELLSSGAYAPILDALIAAVRPAAPRNVLDSGTGTGWYLHGLLDASAPPAGQRCAGSPATSPPLPSRAPFAAGPTSTASSPTCTLRSPCAMG